MSLFSLFRQHDVLTRNIEESERRLKDIKQMKKEGLITNNDVLRSEMQLTNDRLSLTETGKIVSHLYLNSWISYQELTKTACYCQIQPCSTVLLPLKKYDDYVAQACMNDPGILLLRKQTEVAQNDVRLAKAEYLPNISLYAANTLARPISRTMTDMYNNNWNIGLSVSYPLSSLYKNNHKTKES